MKAVKQTALLRLFSISFLLFLATSLSVQAQGDKSKRKSPPKTASVSMDGTNINISYGSPSVRGREVWGALVPYNKVWRTGANEATTFEVSKDVKVNGKALKAGKYALFTIPGEEEWTFIFNKQAEQWGAYKYKDGEDALRVTAKPSKSKDYNEMLTFSISDKGEVSMMWETLAVGFSVSNE